MTKLAGVLLDVDGTLVDSNDAHARAWVKALEEAGFDVPFMAVRRLIGKGGDKLLPEVSGVKPESPMGKGISRRREEVFKAEHLPHLKPFPGAATLLARMKGQGLRLAAASSAKEEELDALLRLCGADGLLEARVSSDDADRSKPDPDILRAALGELGLAPNQVLMLGDTPYDVAAGKRAGVEVVALRCGGWDEAGLEGAIAVYAGPADLLARYDSSPFARAG